MGGAGALARSPDRSESGKHLLAGSAAAGLPSWRGLLWAVEQGLGAAVMALLGALQPPLTAVVASRLFGERLSSRGWPGLLVGLAQ